MSWPLAAYGLLGIALIAGFAWYERSKPDARVVALVGTLAAFAALGRIAFAAVPNVKPTTDIVLISGYALGGAPGFVVGAIAALTSNFFFGQGPWTPWQMIGWGATGMIGAGLAVISRGRFGRWPMAMICFVVGFSFTALQDVGDWVTFSDHSLGQLGVYVGKGVGFDFIHASSCLIFALAFGPALARSLQRFRLRMDINWAVPAALLLAGVALHPTAPAQAATSPPAYLLSAQNSDGGFGQATGAASSPLFSGWAALGLAAAGFNPAHISRDGRTLVAYLEATLGSDPGSLERTILAIHAAGAPVGALASRLERHIRADGSVSEQTNLTAFAVLALRAAAVVPPAKMIAWLAAQSDPDGGFNFATAGGPSDDDDTGAVLEALAGTGHGAVEAKAVRFIRAQQNGDGGLPSGAGANSNAQSTAFAVQGLIAVGVNPASLHRHGAPSPVRYLQSLIAPDGHVDYARHDDETPVWVTAQAELALAGRPLPLSAPRTAAAVTPRRLRAVARRPPARTEPAPTAATLARHRRRRKRQVAVIHRRVVSSSTPSLAGAAGILEAIALAPVGDP